jgi:hypothetical protein
LSSSNAGSLFAGALVFALALSASYAAPVGVSAQIMASERALVSQTIDGTTITIDYSRPRLRGRDIHADLFGNQIHWGEVWTPGANEATTLEADADILIEGVPVPAGAWSVWMVVDPEAWELVLDPRIDLYHTDHPEPAADQIRIPIETTEMESSTEALTWSFPAVYTSGADLRMQWGTVAVDMAVDVEPTVRLTLTAEEAAPYVGTWDVEQLPSEYQDEYRYEMDLRYENEMLLANWEFSEEFGAEMALVVAAEQVFQLGFLMDGEVAEVGGWAFMEFVVDATGRAESFEVRDLEDGLVTRGTRLR